MATNEKIIWQFFKVQGLTDAGVAGLMGNLYAESGLEPTNLQNNFEKKLKYTDAEYTRAVDNGVYRNFVKDQAGYGIAQWTYWSRKEGLLKIAKEKKQSVGSLQVQLEFLLKELTTSFIALLKILKSTNSIEKATNDFLIQFGNPLNPTKEMLDTRVKQAEKYYRMFADNNKTIERSETKMPSNSPLISYTKISPNRTSPRNHEIDTVTIHCVVGQLSVEALGNIFASTSRKASSNYGIGFDGKIAMYCEEKDRSWCSSSASNDHRAITIEVASDTTHPYAVNDKAYAALIELLVDICQRNPGIQRLRWKGDKNLIGQVQKQNMTVHRWFAAKACPGDFLYSRHKDIAERVNRKLDELEQEEIAMPRGETITQIQTPIFQKQELQEKEDDDEDMTQEKFNELMNNWIAAQADREPSTWSKEARDWAERNKIIIGDDRGKKMYRKYISREELATVLYRALHRNFLD